MKKNSKFFLGELANYRDKSVQDVLKDSVLEFLEDSNYNNPGQIKQLLESIGIDYDDFDLDWDALGRMNNRRHQIVHRADKNENHGSGHYSAADISLNTVEGWIGCVSSLKSEISRKLAEEAA